jgi:AcrR family transcriptional regulator
MNFMSRVHTGRARNPVVQQAILDATLTLLREQGAGPLTVKAIAARAGVSRQSVYRWWPSKGAVIAETLAEAGRTLVPVPDHGNLRDDLTAFLGATYQGASSPAVAPVLRGIMATAQSDPAALTALQTFVNRRRDDFRAILERSVRRAELPADADLEFLMDVGYGLLWYRLLLRHDVANQHTASQLADLITRGSEGHR